MVQNILSCSHTSQPQKALAKASFSDTCKLFKGIGRYFFRGILLNKADGRKNCAVCGGMLHHCGKGDHFVGLLTDCEKLYGVNLSQPHLNNMDKVYAETVAKGKKILDLTSAASKEYAARPDTLKGMIFCKNF